MGLVSDFPSRLSKRTVDGLAIESKDAVFWDRDFPGFGVRVYPSGAKVYVVQSRAHGKSRRTAVGRHGVVSAERAHRQARIVRIKAGENPSPAPLAPEVTAADAVERFLREHADANGQCAGGRKRPLRRHAGPGLDPAGRDATLMNNDMETTWPSRSGAAILLYHAAAKSVTVQDGAAAHALMENRDFFGRLRP